MRNGLTMYYMLTYCSTFLTFRYTKYILKTKKKKGILNNINIIFSVIFEQHNKLITYGVSHIHCKFCFFCFFGFLLFGALCNSLICLYCSAAPVTMLLCYQFYDESIENVTLHFFFFSQIR